MHIGTAIVFSIVVFCCCRGMKWCCKKSNAPVTSGSGQPVYIHVSGCSCCYLSLSFTLLLCHHHTVFLSQDPVLSELGYRLQPQPTVRDSAPTLLNHISTSLSLCLSFSASFSQYNNLMNLSISFYHLCCHCWTWCLASMHCIKEQHVNLFF